MHLPGVLAEVDEFSARLIFFDPETYFEQDECPVSLAYVFSDLKMGGEKAPIPSS